MVHHIFLFALGENSVVHAVNEHFTGDFIFICPSIQVLDFQTNPTSALKPTKKESVSPSEFVEKNHFK